MWLQEVQQVTKGFFREAYLNLGFCLLLYKRKRAFSKLFFFLSVPLDLSQSQMFEIDPGGFRGALSPTCSMPLRIPILTERDKHIKCDSLNF